MMRLGRLFLSLVVLVAFVLFAVPNWTMVPLNFTTTEVLVRLPVLLAAAALAGFIPACIAYRLTRRRLARLRLAGEAAFAPSSDTRPVQPSQAQPTCVPPAVG